VWVCVCVGVCVHVCVGVCVGVCVNVQQRKTIYREQCHNYLSSWLFEIVGQTFRRFDKTFHLYINGTQISATFARRPL